MIDPDPTPAFHLLDSLRNELRKSHATPTSDDLFFALGRALRGRLLTGLKETDERFRQSGAKRLHYLSAEFLVGRSLRDNLQNLGLLEAAAGVISELGADLSDVLEVERDAALGSGGLGRLAACYLESLASQNLPAAGYGLNYEYGLFRQELEDGVQRETPDAWRAHGTPWLLESRSSARRVPIYGRVDARREGRRPGGWLDCEWLEGVPSDLPVVGFTGRTMNPLRLYSARAPEPFDMGTFQTGDHAGAVRRAVAAESITKLLYPSDSTEAGRELRLVQEYFLVSCALQDILEQHLKLDGCELEALPERVAIQLNDTHPALAVAELMRLLIDEHKLPFEDAWDLCQQCFAYTNHTLMPEALERWPRPMLLRVLPRHLRLIEQINARFLAQVVERWPGDLDRMRRMSIIEEGVPRHVRMAHLAIVGSHAVNGVSALHTELMKASLVPDFAELWPTRFQNKTNGISPRRWLLGANPALAQLVTEHVGDGWILDLSRIAELEAVVDDPEFCTAFQEVKQSNRERLANHVRESLGVSVDPQGLFDVQIKRIHEYKRQLLAALHAVHLYLRITEDGWTPPTPRTLIFAGKAAPDYWMAKLIIRFLCNVAEVINADPRAAGALRVAYLPNYRVSLAELIVPGADLSEQISTAGTEASGTGNMKLSLNGALTIGTLDGANVEILDAVGEENMYIFGLRTDEIADLRARGAYSPLEHYEESEAIRRVLDAVAEDRFSPRESGEFRPILDALLQHGDSFFVLADFEAYVAAQERAATDFVDRDAWTRRTALTVARMGFFSSDRAVHEYAKDIWGLALPRD
ncbi:MAG: starch phosphorylase [Planctomycetota bacterium]|jgi:starch phosphorylase